MSNISAGVVPAKRFPEQLFPGSPDGGRVGAWTTNAFGGDLLMYGYTEAQFTAYCALKLDGTSGLPLIRFPTSKMMLTVGQPDRTQLAQGNFPAAAELLGLGDDITGNYRLDVVAGIILAFAAQQLDVPTTIRPDVGDGTKLHANQSEVLQRSVYSLDGIVPPNSGVLCLMVGVEVPSNRGPN